MCLPPSPFAHTFAASLATLGTEECTRFDLNLLMPLYVRALCQNKWIACVLCAFFLIWPASPCALFGERVRCGSERRQQTLDLEVKRFSYKNPLRMRLRNYKRACIHKTRLHCVTSSAVHSDRSLEPPARWSQPAQFFRTSRPSRNNSPI